jgi:hypothetical protein
MESGRSQPSSLWLTWMPVLLLIIFLVGCQGLAMPSLDNPGTIAEQESRAIRFDPFVENDIGPPIVGGRPRDYEKPIAEPLRARWPIVQ